MDGDIIAFQASASAQTEVDWGDGDTQIISSETTAVSKAMDIAKRWLKLSRCEKGIICLSDRSIPMSSFRYLYHPLYKRHRTGVKPEQYKAVVEALKSEYKTITIPRLEADDVMGIWATNGKLKGAVVVTTDKDLRNVPARVLIVGKMARPVLISPFQAHCSWMMQTLAGDTSDGYKGCRGVGPAKAEAVIKECNSTQELWGAVVKTFQSKKQTEQDAIKEAVASRILTHEDYNQETGEIRIWHPRNPTWVNLNSLPEPQK